MGRWRDRYSLVYVEQFIDRKNNRIKRPFLRDELMVFLPRLRHEKAILSSSSSRPCLLSKERPLLLAPSSRRASGPSSALWTTPCCKPAQPAACQRKRRCWAIRGRGYRLKNRGFDEAPRCQPAPICSRRGLKPYLDRRNRVRRWLLGVKPLAYAPAPPCAV